MSDDEGPEGRRPAGSLAKPGFFTVYKKGQGYATRLGTALGAMLLLVVLALFVYQQSNAALISSFYTPQTEPLNATSGQIDSIRAANIAGQQHSAKLARATAAGITVLVVAIGAYAAWRLMNAPRSADFLISTDSEMKKVSWPSREELLGSTKVVILFLFVIALLLFLIDVGAGYVFRLIGLLRF